MMTGGNRDDFMSEINVTPFVDVMLVLLIIFMVTAPMMIQGVDVSLPQVTSDPLPTTEQEQLIITLDGSQRVFINDFEVDPGFLGDKLATILEGRKDRTVYLRADKDIPYGVVVRIMSEIRGAGVTKLGMVTAPDSEADQKKKP